jgi:hypothetical protein
MGAGRSERAGVGAEAAAGRVWGTSAAVQPWGAPDGGWLQKAARRLRRAAFVAVMESADFG